LRCYVTSPKYIRRGLRFSVTIFGVNANRRTFRPCFIAAPRPNLANANDIIRATLMYDDYDHEDTENTPARAIGALIRQ
jgi:hypothetical protein